jgi:hypothetical protein
MVEKQNALFEIEIPESVKPEPAVAVFPDEEGIITLKGVEIKWIFKNDYFAKENPEPLGCPHIEFRSDKPSVISETGYRSYFFNGLELEGYKSIKDFVMAYAGFCEKENLKNNSKKKKDKPKKEWKFEGLGLEFNGETERVSYVDFEAEQKIFNIKKFISGFRKTRDNETRLIARVSVWCLDEICNEYEQEFKTTDEIKEFIKGEVEGSKFALEKNKENIFFDTRRYFWKYENKEFKNLGWCVVEPKEEKKEEKEEKPIEKVVEKVIEKVENKERSLDELIADKSKELKELLKNKYGFEVVIKVERKNAL